MDDLKTYSYKRWYDTKPYTDKVLEILHKLSLQSHYDISREVLKVIDTIKTNSREINDAPTSLGIERIIGLFSQNYKRRWYDRNYPINRIFKSASCMHDDDFQNIMQSMYTTLKDDNE